ncbi:catalase-related domain-containing protein [Serpentinicella alkaliphila]|uniref:catalase n=1 Tax=Serpentinicella alkaliphila TaxID=1734049 RepID=A0A4R2TI90_9FIRM|nr:catalase-related domain-containing protein [Serpentinicella alkaliphila]TCQ03228.1 catalase-related immune-responsive protein [Serpentinicella alkaliphila]
MTIDRGRVSYSKNSIQANDPKPASEAQGGYIHYQESVHGRKIRERSDSFMDNFSQATIFWNSMSCAEKQHIIESFHFEVGNVQDMQKIKERVG